MRLKTCPLIFQPKIYSDLFKSRCQIGMVFSLSLLNAKYIFDNLHRRVLAPSPGLLTNSLFPPALCYRYKGKQIGDENEEKGCCLINSPILRVNIPM